MNKYMKVSNLFLKTNMQKTIKSRNYDQYTAKYLIPVSEDLVSLKITTSTLILVNYDIV